uniref:Uncharacterized protein n=1 Tax=Anopheles merus TaxID=30066 RepID=A0A182UUP4_ANOME
MVGEFAPQQRSIRVRNWTRLHNPAPILEHIGVHTGEVGPPAAPTETNDAIKCTASTTNQRTARIALAGVNPSVEAPGTERTVRHGNDRVKRTIAPLQPQHAHAGLLQTDGLEALLTTFRRLTPTVYGTGLSIHRRTVWQCDRLYTAIPLKRTHQRHEPNVRGQCPCVPARMGQVAQDTALLHTLRSIEPIQYASHHHHVGGFCGEAVGSGQDATGSNQRPATEQPTAEAVPPLVVKASQRHVKRRIAVQCIPPADDASAQIGRVHIAFDASVRWKSSVQTKQFIVAVPCRGRSYQRRRLRWVW